MPGVLDPAARSRAATRPAIVGSIVVVGALPVFLVAGWPVAGWAIAAVLWAAGQAIGLVLQRLPLGMGNLASSGAVALGRMFRSVAAMVVLLAVTVSNQQPRALRRRRLRARVHGGVRDVAGRVLRRRGRNMRLKSGSSAVLVGLALVAPASASAADRSSTSSTSSR